MNRSRLEKATASSVVILLSVLTLGFILMVANLIFEWDLFGPLFEKILYFVSICMFLVIVSSVLINIMINFSRLANFSKIIAQKLSEKDE